MLLAALVLALGDASPASALRLRLALALVAVAAVRAARRRRPVDPARRRHGRGRARRRAGRAGPASRWYALLLAAAVTLALDPRAAEEPGWQLSFAAVIAILALHRRLRDGAASRGVPGAARRGDRADHRRDARDRAAARLHFGELSLVSLPANLLAAPAVAPVMWLGTLAGVARRRRRRELLDAVAALPLALPRVARPHGGGAARTRASRSALPGPLAARRALRGRSARPRARPSRAGARARRGAEPRGGAARRSRARSRAAALARAAPRSPGAAAAGRSRMSFLDVGQGDATLLQDGPHAVLVDTGPPGAPIVDELRKAGRPPARRAGRHPRVRRPRGRAAERCSTRCRSAWSSTGAGRGREHGRRGRRRAVRGPAARRAARRSRRGPALRAGPIDLEVLWPPPRRAARAATRTSPRRWRSRGRAARRALLTADAESPVTLPLDLPDVDVLKVAHHG